MSEPHSELLNELREIVQWRYIKADRERQALSIIDSLEEQLEIWEQNLAAYQRTILDLKEQLEAAERARKLLTNALAYYADLEESGHSDWTMATETLEALYGWVPQPETRIPPLSNPASRSADE